MKYEEKIKRLEEIISLMEKGQLSLEDSMEFYEEGIKIHNELVKTLEMAEGKIRVISENGEVNFEGARE